MTHIDRRGFFGLAAGGWALAGALPLPALADARAKVAIIGGGVGGATIAAELARHAPKIEVTLVEAKPFYTTCFFSNHYLAGLRRFGTLMQSYDGLRRLGVNVIINTAVDVDTAGRRITLAGGARLTYDRLVLSPGIDIKYDSVEGYSPVVANTQMPHAWQAGPQTQLLRRQLKAMRDGGVVVMTVPDNPYRCPPGPYERACIIANFLKVVKPRSKLIVLDAKKMFSKQPVFEEAFSRYYKDNLEFHLTNEIDDFGTVSVDPAARKVTTKSGQSFVGDVVNVIPAQRAGVIAARAGSVDGDWCPVNLKNFSARSVKNVYVVGDAAISADMPKSAFSANSQARVVAADLLAELAAGPRPDAKYRNTCWSLLAPDDSVKIGADYAPGEKNGKPILAASGPFVSQPGETPAVRKENFDDSVAWYDTLTADIFANPHHG